MLWEAATEGKFKLLISKIPVFHRHITESVVSKVAEQNAGSRNSSCVQEQDVIGAFFSDVPSPFYSMMVRLLEQNGFNYRKYGYPKNIKS
jgi:adenosine deaminase